MVSWGGGGEGISECWQTRRRRNDKEELFTCKLGDADILLSGLVGSADVSLSYDEMPPKCGKIAATLYLYYEQERHDCSVTLQCPTHHNNNYTSLFPTHTPMSHAPQQ
eukprot:scaffold768_cov174-Ochromonas_danica.AAC.25